MKIVTFVCKRIFRGEWKWLPYFSRVASWLSWYLTLRPLPLTWRNSGYNGWARHRRPYARARNWRKSCRMRWVRWPRKLVSKDLSRWVTCERATREMHALNLVFLSSAGEEYFPQSSPILGGERIADTDPEGEAKWFASSLLARDPRHVQRPGGCLMPVSPLTDVPNWNWLHCTFSANYIPTGSRSRPNFNPRARGNQELNASGPASLISNSYWDQRTALDSVIKQHYSNGTCFSLAVKECICILSYIPTGRSTVLT